LICTGRVVGFGVQFGDLLTQRAARLQLLERIQPQAPRWIQFQGFVGILMIQVYFGHDMLWFLRQ